MKKTLYETLTEYGRNGRYPFHMPGHKRNEKFLKDMDIYDVDITEIDGFDNLHQAEGIIKTAMEHASQFYGTKKTWFLVNGSTCGMHAAISAVTKIGDEILIGRNCHKSVYHAVELRNLKAEYIYPEVVEEYGIYGGYSPEKIAEIMDENEQIKVVVLTSPTYEGMVSDIKTIAKIVHQKNGILIVDEAHGAHFGLCENNPKPAYKCGADIVVESLHKTLPAMTQTAVMHLTDNRVKEQDIELTSPLENDLWMFSNQVKEQDIEHFLDIYETSSPSYVMMASIDRCILRMQQYGEARMKELLFDINQLRNDSSKMKYIKILGKELIGKACIYDVDETKLVIGTAKSNLSGKILSDILRENYRFELEMAAEKYTLAICSVCDDTKQIKRLFESLTEIDRMLKPGDGPGEAIRPGNESAKAFESENKSGTAVKPEDEFGAVVSSRNKLEPAVEPGNERIYSIYEAKIKETEWIAIDDAKDRISAEYAYVYPPGIPIIVPGEMISEGFIKMIADVKKAGLQVNGLSDKTCRKINVVKEKK